MVSPPGFHPGHDGIVINELIRAALAKFVRRTLVSSSRRSVMVVLIMSLLRSHAFNIAKN